MNIKIIIPILNPSKDFFTNNLKILKNQTVKADIILINSGDKIPEDLSYKVIDINKKDFNHANTRNLALDFEADYYLFMTQDALPTNEHLIENLCKGFEKDKEIVVSYARQITYPNADIIEIFARNTNYSEASKLKSKDDLATLGIKTFFNSDSCSMYDAKYFKSIKGFKKDLNTNEDMEYAARAILNNKKVYYNATARVYHSHNFNILEVWKRYNQIGIFFKENDWISKSVAVYVKAESSGMKQAKAELTFILKNKPSYLFKSVIFSFAKFFAFKRGYNKNDFKG
jgi:rhamnosyltransferase